MTAHSVVALMEKWRVPVSSVRARDSLRPVGAKWAHNLVHAALVWNVQASLTVQVEILLLIVLILHFIRYHYQKWKKRKSKA